MGGDSFFLAGIGAVAVRAVECGADFGIHRGPLGHAHNVSLGVLFDMTRGTARQWGKMCGHGLPVWPAKAMRLAAIFFILRNTLIKANRRFDSARIDEHHSPSLLIHTPPILT